jgi:hypothetical protein
LWLPFAQVPDLGAQVLDLVGRVLCPTLGYAAQPLYLVGSFALQRGHVI